jgi:CRISPR/Cas system-associated exonuclease Cas4 (RecB family)
MIELARSRALLNVLSLVNEEEMPVEQAFLRDLKASIERDASKNVHVASRTYKPSGMNCIRFMWFQLTGVEPKADNRSAELEGICESGTDRHERIQNAIARMKDNGIDCEYIDVAEYVTAHNLEDLEIVSKQGNETKLYNKRYNISFLCDGIVRYKGKYYILEIKTETRDKFWAQTDTKAEHKLQGTAYSLSFGINDVLYLYECRDNCAKKCYLFHVTEDMKQDIVAKIFECDDFVRDGICPPKPTDLTKSSCAYCNYSEVCKTYA